MISLGKLVPPPVAIYPASLVHAKQVYLTTWITVVILELMPDSVLRVPRRARTRSTWTRRARTRDVQGALRQASVNVGWPRVTKDARKVDRPSR